MPLTLSRERAAPKPKLPDSLNPAFSKFHRGGTQAAETSWVWTSMGACLSSKRFVNHGLPPAWHHPRGPTNPSETPALLTGGCLVSLKERQYRFSLLNAGVWVHCSSETLAVAVKRVIGLGARGGLGSPGCQGSSFAFSCCASSGASWPRPSGLGLATDRRRAAVWLAPCVQRASLCLNDLCSNAMPEASPPAAVSGLFRTAFSPLRRRHRIRHRRRQ